MNESKNVALDEPVDIDHRIAYDRLTFFYLSMPVALIGHMLGALLFSALLYGAVDTFSMLVWLTLSSVLFFYRFYHYYQFKRENEYNKMRDHKIWTHRFYSDVLVSGLIWGSSAILIFPSGDIMNQMIVVVFIFAIGFTSMGNLSAKMGLLLTYVLLSFVPLVIQLMSLNEQKYLNLGMLVVVLMMGLIAFSRYFGNVINDSLRSHQDFTKMKNSHEILQERFFSLFERAPVGIFYYNKELEILDSNAHFLDINDCQTKEDLIGQSLSNTNNMNLLKSYNAVFNNNIGEYKGPFTSLKSEAQLYVNLNTVPILDAKGLVSGGITIIKDVTEEINAKESMLRNAYYDMLTNIPNRTLLMDRLEEVIKTSKEKNDYAAVLYLDLDNFKKLNVTFGHDNGDAALKQVAERIINRIGFKDTLARLGGDKFVILLAKLSNNYDVSLQDAMKKAQTILDTLEKPLNISGEDYHIGASIGVHLLPFEDSGPYDILKRAETAMYEAKASGRNAIAFYRANMGDAIAEYITIDNDLRKALANNELQMYYQPQLNVQSDEITGAEALIRWIHPTKGSIPADKFIPIAEESGYIVELSHWIIDSVVRDIKKLSEQDGGFKLDHIAINVNSFHFLKPNFSEELKSVIEKYHVRANYVEVEITEGVIMHNVDEAVKKMRELKDYGIKFSMDDFGTGYSSLSYLNQLPFDTLKIDQAFIVKMTEDKNNAKLVHSIIDIAKNFNLEVVAEGVETKEVLELLKNSTCNIYQGYYSHRPMPFSEFYDLLEKTPIYIFDV